MKKSVKYKELSDVALMEKWLSAFGKGVDKNIMEEHVISYGNLLWHLFTWGEVPCQRERMREKHLMSCSMRRQYGFTMDMPVILKGLP